MAVYKMAGVHRAVTEALEDWGDTPVPVDGPASQLRGLAETFAGDVEVGVWEASPGRWQRQIKEAEMCYFLSGHCSYTDEAGLTTDISAGDLLHFPADSGGIWEIYQPTRKVFIVYPDRSGR